MPNKKATATRKRSPCGNLSIINEEILPMSKPLGYYTAYTPGDNSLLEKLQEEYGSTFEKITKREKLVILTVLASHIGCQLDGDVRGEIFAIAKQMRDQLSLSDQGGVMQAIIEQIRWGQNAEPVHHS
ncbi:MAG: hypothetical protein RMY16_08410 [Nostoc sp. DedQUE12b]|uniref:hypothetical protein n=1 Tax=Nostoc sp. DedQUE12b TaxID=3075398 RepID=UPI002AD36C00|nr:hypothetical protein [Nostoc sp. DedQUE12b]MDZ8085604.1 hypothetical protein [Nostoc sp. DedQUE12b]